MKKSYFIISAGLFMSAALMPYVLHAQNSFAKMIPNYFRPSLITADSSGDLFIYGDGQHIVRMDANGNVKWHQKYPLTRTIDRVIKTPSGTLLAAYCRNDTAAPFYTHPGIMLLDSTGAVIWSKEDTSFHSHPSTRFKQHFLRRGSEIIWIQLSGANNHLVKINYNGDILSQHANTVQMSQAIWAPDNFIYSIGYSGDFSKTDTSGNLIYRNSHIAGDHIALSDLCLRGNDVFLGGYYFPHYPSFVPSMPVIFKTSNTGTLVNAYAFAWQNDSAQGSLLKILATPDGGFILTCWRQTDRTMVMKVDSIYLNLFAFDTDNDVNQLHDATLTADGDFAFSAFHTSASYPNKTLVLKTDVSADLAPCYSPMAIDSVFLIYPQFMSFPGSAGLLSNSYVSSVIADSLDPVIPLNYCTGLSVPESEHESTFTVFPNPGTGVFGIIPAEQIMEWNVRNITGQTILKNNDGGLEFDLSDQAPGVYVVEIKTAGKLILHQRVLKE